MQLIEQQQFYLLGQTLSPVWLEMDCVDQIFGNL